MLTNLAPFVRHLKGKGRLIAAVLLLGLAGTVSSLATPLIGKSFVDEVAGRGNFSLLPRIALLLLGLAVADQILGGCSRMLHARLSARVLVEIRERLFAHCLHAPLDELERFRHGDLLNRFGADIPKIQTLLVDGLMGCFQNLLFVAIAAFILLRLSVPLALWSFLGLIVALFFTHAFGKPVERGTKGVREAMVDLSHFLSERLGALRAVRFHAAQAAEKEAFASHNDNLVRRVMKFQALDLSASGFPALTLTASLAWIYLMGGRLIETHAITLGTFVAFILYQGRLVAPAMGLLGLMRNLQEAKISLERVAELLGGEGGGPVAGATGEESRDCGDRGILVEGLCFSYAAKASVTELAGEKTKAKALTGIKADIGDNPGGRPVLKELQLRVDEGERIAIFGASGSGKSTLVQILFGLRVPQRGKVLVGGSEVRGGGCGGVRMGYAGCDPFLQHGTVAQNLRYGNAGRTDAELRAAAHLAEAHEFIQQLPLAYDTVIGGRGIALSDGQRQRIGIARLLLYDPDIVVLDEALSALDPETESRVRRNLLRHFAGRSLIMISHHLQVFDDFDALYLMEGGRLGKVGHRELGAKQGAAPLRPVQLQGPQLGAGDAPTRRQWSA